MQTALFLFDLHNKYVMTKGKDSCNLTASERQIDHTNRSVYKRRCGDWQVETSLRFEFLYKLVVTKKIMDLCSSFIVNK